MKKKPSKALKTLLWVSELKEQKAKEDFQKAKKALWDLEEILKEITQKPKKMYAEIEGQTLEGAFFQDFSRGLEMIFKEKIKVEKILDSKRKEVDMLREQALRLHRKRKAAETLYDRAWRHYWEEQEKEALKESDDLVLLRRKSHEGL